jgi:hypothetical protein
MLYGTTVNTRSGNLTGTKGFGAILFAASCSAGSMQPRYTTTGGTKPFLE